MAYGFRRVAALQCGLTGSSRGKGETVMRVRRCYAIGVTIAAVILLCALTRPVHAGVLDCVSGPLGSGNPSGCTDADRKHYEELKKQTDAEMLAWKATMDYCEHNPKGPSDKCPEEYRKIIDKVRAESMAKEQREYEIWLQGAEARKQEVKAKQEALLQRELAESERQYRAEARQRYEDDAPRRAAELHEQQAAYQQDVDDEVNRINSYNTERAAQSAQQQTAEQQTRRQTAAPLRQPVARPRPDPLAPAPAPAQTPESRRAAGLPDDPNAAACIQDDDCARAVLGRGH